MGRWAGEDALQATAAYSRSQGGSLPSALLSLGDMQGQGRPGTSPPPAHQLSLSFLAEPPAPLGTKMSVKPLFFISPD